MFASKSTRDADRSSTAEHTSSRRRGAGPGATASGNQAFAEGSPAVAVAGRTAGLAVQRMCSSCAEEEDEQPLAVQRSAADGAPAPAAPVPAPAASAPQVIVDDSAPAGPGQMTRSAFMASVRAQATAVCNEELAAAGQSADGCPYLERWLSHYEGQPAVHVERAVRAYTGAQSSDASAMLGAVSARIRSAVRDWVSRRPTTPTLSGIATAALGGLSRLLPGSEPSPAGPEALQRKPDSAGHGSAGAGAGRGSTADPHAVAARLGPGQSLASAVSAPMERAFGQSFAHVRVHTDSAAGTLSREMRAHAFTVGEHIAFAPGTFQPGTLRGDALLAHELAHVVQQGSATGAAPRAGEDPALEVAADTAAASAVASLWQRGQRQDDAAPAVSPAPSAGMRLQRCSDDRPIEQRFMPMSAEERAATERMRQDIAMAEELLADPSLSEADRAALSRAVASARGAVSGYVSVREEGETRAYIMAPIMVASTGIVADDATVVGVADDPLLIVLGLAALVTWIATNPPAGGDAIADAWRNVGSQLEALALAVEATVLMTAAGNVIHGHIEEEARQLAVTLGLAATAAGVTREMLCDMLERMARQYRRSDTEKWKKIISTQKGLGCRGSRASR